MLGRYDRAMRARQPVGGQTLLARAIAAIRRNNGALFYVPSNALGDGAPNLLSAPEFAAGLADAPIRGGLVTLSSMPGYDNAIAFGVGETSFAYKTTTHTNGLPYTMSVIIAMDDGLAPVVGSGVAASSANTLSIILFGTSVGISYTVTALSDGTYRVTGTLISTGANINFGILKYATNNNRTFKVTGYKLELGSTATAYTPQSVLRNLAFLSTALAFLRSQT